jgi:hypothetical protein
VTRREAQNESPADAGLFVAENLGQDNGMMNRIGLYPVHPVFIMFILSWFI